MKQYQKPDEPVNVIGSKDRSRNFYIAYFDATQINPRVTLGSLWIGIDKRYNRKYLMRVIEMGYSDDYEKSNILYSIRENPNQPLDPRSLEYYCSEVVWLRLEGEFKNGSVVNVYEQPTVWQTFLKPVTDKDNLIVASPDIKRGFVTGNLRSGAQLQEPVVTLEDRFMGYRTLITGASGFGKSTLVRNIARYWLERTNYGKIIDDLKGEYVDDTSNEQRENVPGLCHHPHAKDNLYLLTPNPERFSNSQLDDKIAGILKLQFDINDIPPQNLQDIETHLSIPQKSFLNMYQDKKGLFSLLLREDKDENVITDDWYRHFKYWIIAIKSARDKVKSKDYIADLTDFDRSSYQPIFGVIRLLKKLSERPYVNTEGNSCLQELRRLLKKGKTIILDKSGLTDGDKSIISTVIAKELYSHNEKYSSGSRDVQKHVIPFVYIVEEAHLLLSKEKAMEGSVFVDFAKTGRSFQIGLVAVTQRPSSVDTNILSQFDNFVTFRLTNEQDVKDLVKAKSEFQGYEGDIRTMRRGAAVTAFGEPTKVQSIQVFNWSEERAKSLLSDEQRKLIEKDRKSEGADRDLFSS